MTASSPPPKGPDPTEQSRWRPVWALLAAMDREIARLYADRGLADIRPRYAVPLIRLDRRGPMTIRQLADAVDVTHSAMSQTVTALRRSGLVRSVPGADARTREITLTERAREVVPFIEAEWRATERALADIEAELPYPLSRAVRDVETELARRSFYDRIVDNLGPDEAAT